MTKKMIEIKDSSPFERAHEQLIDNGLSVIPIFADEKKPGSYAKGQWFNFVGWQKYCKKIAPCFVLEEWSKWPGCGIGVTLGPASGLVAVDVDYTRDIAESLGVPGLVGALDAVIPGSPVKKKGAKGYTAFFRLNGEETKAFRVRGKVILDLLSTGRQTVMPPSRHPDGVDYCYITPDTLEDFDPNHLPVLPADFVQQVENAIEPFQIDGDKHDPREFTADGESSDFRNVNDAALANLSDWVPLIFEDAQKSGSGYRVRADWRSAENYNVGIDPKGIRDFGGDYSLTPIDLVIKSTGLKLPDAKNWLEEKLGIERETLVFIDDRTEAEKNPPPQNIAPLPDDKPFFIDINDIELREPCWLVENYFEKNTLNCFFGDPGSGKSFAAIDVALSIANGVAWGGEPTTQGAVLYIAGEGHNGLKKRVSAWEQENQIKTPPGLLFFSQAPAMLSDEKSAAWIAGQIEACAVHIGRDPVLIVIDTLARNMGADENSARDMGDFVLHVDRYIRRPHEASVLIVHHTGHADKTRARGSMSLKGALDSEFLIENDEKMTLSCTKMKDFIKPIPKAFIFKSVEIELNGNMISSAVLDETMPDIVQNDDGTYSGIIDDSDQLNTTRIAYILAELKRVGSLTPGVISQKLQRQFKVKERTARGIIMALNDNPFVVVSGESRTRLYSHVSRSENENFEG